MRSLTPKQLATLDALRAHAAEHGVMPTLRELGDRLNVSRVTVHERMTALERKGRVRVHGHRARGIEIVDDLDAALQSLCAEYGSGAVRARLEAMAGATQ